MAYETFQICGLLNLSNLNWKAPVLTANFGDGYGAGALSGSAAGLYRWTLDSSLLPDIDGQHLINYSLDSIEYTDTRFSYLLKFIQHHLRNGNKPFYITDPRSGRTYLASFTDDLATNGVEFGAITAKIFEGSVEIVQRRAEDLSFDANGALSDTTATTRITDLVHASHTRLTINLQFTYVAAVVSGAVKYEVRKGNDEIIDKTSGVVPTTGDFAEIQMDRLTPNTSYTFRIRTADAAGNYSGWSNAVVQSTDA
jgi:hypothetical protein